MTLRSAIIVFCLLGVGAASAAVMTRREMTELFVQSNDAFRRANAQIDTEQSKRLYEQAILGYERIIHVGGVRNPMLYYNLANAHLLKGDVGRAILNYRRAEALDRSSRDIRKNLAFARGRRLDTVQVRTEQRVLQTLFFWHYDLSLKTRFSLGCIFFAIACLSLTLRIAPRTSSLVHRPSSVVLGVAAVLTLCMAASVVTGVVTDARRVEGVIVADEVVARQADWPDAAPSFKESLHAGLEFEVIEQRRDYLHIRLPDGSDGWIPTTAAELI